LFKRHLLNFPSAKIKVRGSFGRNWPQFFFFVKRHLFESQIRKFFLRGCYGYVLLAAATVSVAFDMLLSPLPLRVEFWEIWIRVIKKIATLDI
jgi:hypothetical protein